MKTQAARLTRRTLVQGGLGAATGLAAQAALSPRPQARAAQGSGEVSFMNWATVAGTPLETALNAFQEQAGISVNVQPAPTTEYETKMRTLLASGAPPDVMRINDNLVRDFATANQLLDLKPYIDAAGETGYIESLFIFPVTPDGTHPAWVIGTDPRAFFYNATMFEEAGVPPPPDTWTSENWTWDDFLETARALTIEGERWGANVYSDTGYEQTWIVNNGVEAGIYSEDGTKFTMAEPAAIEAIQWATDLSCEHGVQPPWSELQPDVEDASDQLFAAGRVGMYFATFGLVPYLNQNVSDFTWDIAPVPAKVNQQQEGSLIVFCIPKDAKNPDAAWELLRFLGGPDGGGIFAETGYFIPVWEEAGAQIQPGNGLPPHVGLFAEAATHNSVVSPNAVGQGRARMIYRQQLDLVYTCQKSAEEVLTGVREEVEAILAEEAG